jgi:hypothetical protein
MTQTISYEITGQIGEIEFRKYPRLVLATVMSPGNDGGFNLLFSYITGKNHTKRQIQMTAPVITSEQIPMTAPVVSDEKSMSFVMPGGKEQDEIPDPLDERVKITTQNPREMAVIRFKGYAGREDVNDVKSRLLEGLQKSGITARGQPVLMRYNAPWTPGFLRRNEVGIEITR